ncbi:4Fe-4S dicluster domain-containing protein, partial [Klebsiella pneumoniae]
MALLITKKCINCDMCEPECPLLLRTRGRQRGGSPARRGKQP